MVCLVGPTYNSPLGRARFSENVKFYFIVIMNYVDVEKLDFSFFYSCGNFDV